MEINSHSVAAPSANVSLEQLASDKSMPEQQRLDESCRQFEAVLIREILGDAQKSAVSSKMNLNSGGSSIYHDMVNAQMADQMSRGGGIGLSRALSHELSRHSHPAADGKTGGTPKS